METTEREKGVITEVLTMADKDSAPITVGLLRHVVGDVSTLREALEAATDRLDTVGRALKTGRLVDTQRDAPLWRPLGKWVAEASAILGPTQGDASIRVGGGECTVDGKPVEEAPLPVAATCRDCGWEFKQNLDPPYTWTVAGCYPEHHLVHLFHGPPLEGHQIAAIAIDKRTH